MNFSDLTNKKVFGIVVVVLLLVGLLAGVLLTQKQTRPESGVTGDGKVYLSLRKTTDNKIALFVDKVEGLAAAMYLTAHITFDPNQVDTSSVAQDYFKLNSKLFIDNEAAEGEVLANWKSTGFNLNSSSVEIKIFTSDAKSVIASANGQDLKIAEFPLKFTKPDEVVQLGFDLNASMAQGSGGVKYILATSAISIEPENVVKLYFGQDQLTVPLNINKTVPLYLDASDKKVVGAHLEINLNTSLPTGKNGFVVLVDKTNTSFDSIYSMLDSSSNKLVIDAFFSPESNKVNSGVLKVADINVVGYKAGSVDFNPICVQNRGGTAICSDSVSSGSVVLEAGGDGKNILRIVKNLVVTFSAPLPVNPTATPTPIAPIATATPTSTPIAPDPQPIQPSDVKISLRLPLCSDRVKDREVTVWFNYGIAGAGAFPQLVKLDKDSMTSTVKAPKTVSNVVVRPEGYLPVQVSGSGIQYRSEIDLYSVVFTPGNSSPSQFPRDEIINTFDFRQFIADFEQVLNNKPANPASDYDCDGKINVVDYSHLVSNWGKKLTTHHIGDDN